MSLNTSLLILLVASFSSLVLSQNDSKKGGLPKKVHFSFGPAYLRNLTKEEKQQYYAIFGNKDLTIKQQEDQRLAFAEKHGFGQAIKDDIKLKAGNHELIRKERPEIIKNLLAAHEATMKIFDNKDQTLSQREAAVNALKKKYPHAPSTLYYISRLITGNGKHQTPFIKHH
ncbi:SXP/RAL-2 family protein Ani s 5-like cation-binding domain-containing protein [Caenorhabditis elegans]|uniref:SXP/RAL-2 family protein Ani s 5-like cation-binding domain-containing protein n=1 Tax=Caenorhabditis elegans TaxID=6239 RepID=O17974_CAEEL|nr:SXP/RAL-2 family protein Ani s 5-like cation-binding domain-containing protein [Caenorhabditis elegans]CAA92752.1 SXP/RAL-2 family protein Ani s 5-like cation-binding domain-containing protein [Caenorhabditis elegans]|eukprot:NP_502072.1 Uncharacterized protein CELE_M7.9 [Caenorhabditis elegans]